VQTRRKSLSALEDQVEKFGAGKHFMTAELEARFGAVQARYEALHEPLQIRRENLEDSLLLHQFNRNGILSPVFFFKFHI
jgi:spectrin beta